MGYNESSQRVRLEIGLFLATGGLVAVIVECYTGETIITVELIIALIKVKPVN